MVNILFISLTLFTAYLPDMTFSIRKKAQSIWIRSRLMGIQFQQDSRQKLGFRLHARSSPRQLQCLVI